MKRPSSYLVVLALISLCCGTVAAQPPGRSGTAAETASNDDAAGSYIVLMSLDPVIAYEGGIEGYAPTKPGKGGKINPNSAHVRKYRELIESDQDRALESAGLGADQVVNRYSYALNGFSALLTGDQAGRLARQKGVVSVLEDKLRQLETDASPGFLGLIGPGSLWDTGYTGEDVIVGVIDSGIWPEHPSFADDGSYGPLSLTLNDTAANPACNFGNTAHNSADSPFTCNNKLLGARQMLATYRALIGATPGEFDSARDDDGHGTHTASTATGNGAVDASIFGIPRGSVSGIAPRARVIAYKGLGELGGFDSDLAAAIDQAVADGVDVINYSVGGGASLTGADDIAFLFAADAGVFVATSAGNSGPAPATIGSPASVPWLISVAASFHDRAFISDITVAGPGSPPAGLWGGSVTPGIENYNLVDAQGILDTSGDTSGQCLNPFPTGTFLANDAVLCNNYNFGVSRSQRVAHVAGGGGGAVIFHNVPTVNMTPTDNHPLPTVHMLADVGQPLKDYLVANPGQVTVSFTQSTSQHAPGDPRVTPGEMASFSSRGPDPVAQDIIKPDVTAPGISILAGASPIHVGAQAPGQLFQAIMGTSMSSPHVAGLFALIKQAHPDWSPATAKSALMTTAYQELVKDDGVTPADPFDAGSGHVNPGNGVHKGSAFQPGLAYDAGFLEYLGFLCDADPAVFADPAGTCSFLESIGVPVQAINLNLPSIGISEVPGSATVRRTLTSVAKEKGRRTYHVAVDPPPGYDVTVSPDEIELKSGQSAEYEVTVANNGGGVIGQWAFGSLLWSDTTGHYDVYSPIAVRAVLFDAPGEISGSGASGTASFEVRFGYTGSYTAAPHGLVAATITADNVVQDPDQNFDPLDGFSNLHQFNLAAALHLRAALPPDATEAGADLDIYVFGPGGNLMASSTNDGTDEQVDVALPADGIWSVYVHGWLTPGGNSSYDLSTWTVPAASGGSLVLDSAPAAALIGETGTVDASWSGLASGDYLGAVSHVNGGAGLLGTTLLSVDVP